MSGQQKLNDVLIEWDRAVEAFQDAVTLAAEAHVAWERYAARKRITLR